MTGLTSNDVRIITDCAADMPADEVAALGVHLASLYIHLPDGEVDASGLAADDFYDHLQSMYPHIPTTSQPSPGEFAELYRSLAVDGREMLSIHVSSGLSATVQSARLGARQVPETRVTVLDSMTLAGGQRFQVLAAAWAAQRGWPHQAVLERLAAIREATEVVYALETLEYLRRGGRMGRVEGFAGSLLRIKPIIHVERADGKYSVVGKGLSMGGLLRGMAHYLQRVYGRETPLWVTVQHGQRPRLAEALAQELRLRLSVAKLEFLRVSPILGVHTGPGVVGASAVPMAAFDGLMG